MTRPTPPEIPPLASGPDGGSDPARDGRPGGVGHPAPPAPPPGPATPAPRRWGRSSTTPEVAAALAGPRLAVSVIVPTRNSADWVLACLREPRAEGVVEIIVVDGGSTDGTLGLVEPLADKLLRDDGSGPAAARMLGVAAATQPWILLLDSDVVFPPGGIARLLDEAMARGLDGIQAAQESEGTGDRWSEALAAHHRRGASRRWFGTNATLVRREVLEQHPLDAGLRSGEDIDLRIRLRRARVPVGVSEHVTVTHRYAPGRAAAAQQWDDDGRGLGRMVRKHGWSAVGSAAIPLAVGSVGVVAALFRGGPDGPRYYVGYLVGNYRGLWRGLLDGRVPMTGPSAVAVSMAGLVVAAFLAVALAIVLPAALLLSAIGDDPRLVGIAGLTSVLLLVWLEIGLSYPADDGRHRRAATARGPVLVVAGIGLALAGLRLLSIVRPF